MTVYRTANLAFQLPGDGRLIEELANGADVLLLVECRDGANRPVPVAEHLGKEWRVMQDTSSGERAGSVIAVRRGAVQVSWTRMLLASRPGVGVQGRYLRVAQIRDLRGLRRVGVLHNPPGRRGGRTMLSGRLGGWVRRARRAGVPWVLAGDFNMAHEQMRDWLGAPFSAGLPGDPMGIVWGRGWGLASVRRSRVTGGMPARITQYSHGGPDEQSEQDDGSGGALRQGDHGGDRRRAERPGVGAR